MTNNNLDENIDEDSNLENLKNLDFANLNKRQIQLSLTIRSLAQDFFQKNSSGVSLITITRANISKDLKNTTIYLTIFPEKYEEQGLAFAKRMRTDLRTELKKKLQIRTIPVVEIKIDKGEKARQELDESFRKLK